MKKLKHGKVILYAAAIILICAGALIVSIHVAFGAEEGRKTTEPGEIGLVTQTGQNSSEPIEPGAQYITKEDAVALFRNIASDIFNEKMNAEALTATFQNEPHAIWEIGDNTFSCTIDAISGEVLSCERITEYTGDRITQSEYDNHIHDTLTFPSGDNVADMYNSPDNIYIKTALQITNDHLTKGRTIENAAINAAQFSWEASMTSGTIQADVDVLMETGRSYRLSFWGASSLVVAGYYSFPTQEACLWGYYYEDDAPEFSDEWQQAPGITTEPMVTPTIAPN